ncbi:hypothetical protein [Fibrobacter sp.]|uniref:hypothetical protein n=1 Tax=Fibrobacter sp. TaxID=35828 RepID=UPI00388D3FC9
MIDVLKIFYTTHYNFAAFCILLVMLLIFLLTKKNMVWSIVIVVVLIAINIFIYKRTEGREWTIVLDSNVRTVTEWNATNLTFSVYKDWTIKDEKGEEYHWCWVEEYWEKIRSFDAISMLWAEDSKKKKMLSTERRITPPRAEPAK